MLRLKLHFFRWLTRSKIIVLGIQFSQRIIVKELKNGQYTEGDRKDVE